MKKQRKTYILLAVVLGIWGVIGFRIVNTINPPVAKAEAAVTQANFVPKTIEERDTFSIAANYRDPFLGTLQAPKKAKKKRIVTPKKAVPKKNITYAGFIADKNAPPTVFFVTIDGQQQMMSINDVFQEVKLLHGTKNKIKVRYNNHTQTLALAQ